MFREINPEDICHYQPSPKEAINGVLQAEGEWSREPRAAGTDRTGQRGCGI